MLKDQNSSRNRDLLLKKIVLLTKPRFVLFQANTALKVTDQVAKRQRILVSSPRATKTIE